MTKYKELKEKNNKSGDLDAETVNLISRNHQENIFQQ